MSDPVTGPTIPEAIWQTILTVFGAIIGAVVADRVARRGEKRRDFQAAAYEFDVTVSKLLFLVQKEKYDLGALLRNNIGEIERVVFKVRFYLHEDCRAAFDAQWRQYASLQHGQLQANSVRKGPNDIMILDYANACKVMSEPLETMLKIVQQSAR